MQLTRRIGLSSTLVLLGLLGAAPAAFAQGGHEGHDHAAHDKAPAAPAFAGDPYLLPTDPVTGAHLPAIDEQIVLRHEGRELRFANEESVEAFREDPARYLQGVDRALIAMQLPYYPLRTCPVSGEALGGSMGAPVDVLVGNRLVRLCCKGCSKKLAGDPAKYVAMLDAAVLLRDGPTYALETCPVSGEKLGGMGAPIDRVVGNRLVRLCCKGCIKKFDRDPLRYMAALGGTSEGATGHDDGDHGGHDASEANDASVEGKKGGCCGG